MIVAGDSRNTPGPEVTDLWAAGRLGKRSNAPPEVLFGQVHEDAGVEVEALAACPPPEVAFCIGSGGCTAFSLLTRGPANLFVVDINPAQIYLIELKRAALEHLAHPEMLECITVDAVPFYAGLREHLTFEARHFWDEREALMWRGLGRCGLIERRLHRFTRLLLPLLHGRRNIHTMFQAADLATQQQFYRARWDDWRWKWFFRTALSRPALRLIYGKPFVDRIPVPFAALVKQRVDAAFLDFPIAKNCYLWQAFLGRYPPTEEGLPIYLRRENHSMIRSGLPRTELITADAADWLSRQSAASIGFFALSNILEITTASYAERLATALWRAAKPGAIVCCRAIFPPGPAEACFSDERFRSERDLSEELARSDRSLLCKLVQVFRVLK